MAVRTYGPWIDWEGRTKRCPLAAGTHHQVKFRDGQIATDDSPETWTWKWGRVADGRADPTNIMAYRVERFR